MGIPRSLLYYIFGIVSGGLAALFYLQSTRGHIPETVPIPRTVLKVDAANGTPSRPPNLNSSPGLPDETEEVSGKSDADTLPTWNNENLIEVGRVLAPLEEQFRKNELTRTSFDQVVETEKGTVVKATIREPSQAEKSTMFAQLSNVIRDNPEMGDLLRYKASEIASSYVEFVKPFKAIVFAAPADGSDSEIVYQEIDTADPEKIRISDTGSVSGSAQLLNGLKSWNDDSGQAPARFKHLFDVEK